MLYCVKDAPKPKATKPKLTSDIEESASRILNEYLQGNQNIPEINCETYLIGKTMGSKSGKVQKQTHS